MESNYNRHPDYFKFQVHLYSILEKEMFLNKTGNSNYFKMGIAIIGLLGEAFNWLSEKSGSGIGTACNLMCQLCKSQEFKDIIDIAKWIVSEKNKEDIFPANMTTLKTLIKELIIEYIYKNLNDGDKKIELSPKDIFGEDYECNQNCSACSSASLCEKLHHHCLIGQRPTIYI